MKTLIESARLATDAAKEQIAKLREKFTHGEPEYEMADDAFLGLGWAAKRLRDLEKSTEDRPPATGPQ